MNTVWRGPGSTIPVIFSVSSFANSGRRGARAPPRTCAPTVPAVCANHRRGLREPSSWFARTFNTVCARLCHGNPDCEPSSSLRASNEPSATIARTFVNGCANLRQRLRKPSSTVARTFVNGCANLRQRLRGPWPWSVHIVTMHQT